MSSVAFISTDFNPAVNPPEPNGCAWYRLVLPSREVQKFGWETGVGMPRATADMGFGIAHGDGAYFGWDVTVLKLLMHSSTPDMIRVMQSKGQRVIVDVDDFHFGIHPENIAARNTDPNINPETNRMFFEMGIRAADTVTVSTEFLANFYEQRCRDVRLIRNAIDVDRFTMVTQPDVPTFGWVGATMWRSGDIEMLADWLPEFARVNNVPVHHSGHIPGDSRHFAVRAGMKRVNTVMMQPITKYPSLLQHINVGLVPLVRTDFNEAKSNLKGLEYAASGIPFIATPTKEYELLAKDGVGRLASSPEEWAFHATQLLDPEVRRVEAEYARKVVEEKYNITVRGEQWVTALNG